MLHIRKLAAILVSDVVGYSRLAGENEDRVLAQLRTLRSDLIDPTVAMHKGRVFKRTGDGAIVEFHSVVEAVRCAIEIQNAMAERNAGVPEDRQIVFRIGIHLGDVVEESDGDLMGDGVNIAARLEGVAEPGGIAVSDDAWRHARSKVAVDAVDMGEHRLKNISTPIRVFRLRLDDELAVPAEAAVPSFWDRPSIAVLPFENMSGDPEQDYFCDGLVDDILTSLSKLRELRVIARNSSFAFKGRATDVREVGRQLGARYVLEGGVRKSGVRMRITVQLIDARDGSHVWAERYDRALADIFAIQDEVTLILATEMQVRFSEGEQARLRYTTTTNIDAWTLWVQGLSHYRRGISKENVGLATAAWEKALTLDPASAALNAMLGWMHAIDARFGWTDERAQAMAKARAYLERALELDADNSDAHMTAAGLMWIERRFEEAEVVVRKALSVAPGSADVANLASFYLTCLGRPEEAIVQSRKAMALNPNYPANYLGNLGFACRLAGRVDEAIAAFRTYDLRASGSGAGLPDLVILYQHSERPDEAAAVARRLIGAKPQFTVGAWLGTQILRDEDRLASDAAALRAAGLPN